MTPLARRVMEKVRQKAPGTYEEWVQAHVDFTLEEAAERLLAKGYALRVFIELHQMKS